MLLYKVYSKDYKRKQGQLLGVLVERRKDLRGQTPLESGLKWAKVAFSSSLEKKHSVFIVPKELELRADAEAPVGKRILPKQMPADVLSFPGWDFEIARGEQSDPFLDGILPQFMAPTSCTHFYGLSGKPFELISDPDFFYMTANYRETLRTITDGIKNRSGVILILGEPGVGKTTLIRYLLNGLDGKVKTVLLSYPAVTFEEFLRFLLRELSLKDKGKNEKDLLGQLNDYLLQKLAGDKTLVLFIDEAQTHREEVLGGLGKLLDESRQIQIVLIGQPELKKKLFIPKLSSLKEKIARECKIKKLSQRESQEYIDYRLQLVGSSISRLFTPGAIAMIIAYARGVPRVINVTCDSALLKGYFSAKRRVDKAVVRKVIREKEGLTRLPVGPFGTLAGLRFKLSTYLQTANSTTQTMFGRMIRMICL